VIDVCIRLRKGLNRSCSSQSQLLVTLFREIIHFLGTRARSSHPSSFYAETQINVCIPFNMSIICVYLHGLLISVGPIVTSDAARAAELDVSLLERLFERPIYADNPQARSRMSRNTLDHQNSTYKPFTNLVKVRGSRHL
jgi:hypothetical protein